MPSQETNSLMQKKSLSYARKFLKPLPPLTFTRSIEPSSQIIFVHIAKTAGTNLSFLAQALDTDSNHFSNVRFRIPRKKNTSPNLITENWIGGLQTAFDTLKKDPTFCDNKNFISGQFPFGLHHHMSTPAKYVTLIRNPVDRALSTLNFDYQRGFIDKEHAEQHLLNANIDNPQTRILAGASFMSGECTQKTLEQAKKNIEQHFLLTGITEEADTFIQALASIQGWGPIALARAQVTKEKVFNTLDPDLLKQIEQQYTYDMQLYRWVKDRWYRWKKENIGEQPTSNVNHQEKFLCLPCEFANTRIPLHLSFDEISTHNVGIDPQTLVCTNQISEKLAKDLFSTPILPESKTYTPIQEHKKRQSKSSTMDQQSDYLGSFQVTLNNKTLRRSRRLAKS